MDIRERFTPEMCKLYQSSPIFRACINSFNRQEKTYTEALELACDLFYNNQKAMEKKILDQPIVVRKFEE